LALFVGLWESSAYGSEEPPEAPQRIIVIEAARSYVLPTASKLRLGLRYHQEGQWEQAQHLYEEVLWETRDSEEVAAVRQLLLQLGDAPFWDTPLRSVPSASQMERPLASLPPVRPSQPAETLQSPSLAQAGRPLLSWLESSVPLFVELTAKRMAQYIEGVGEDGLTRVCTEAEFKQIVLRNFKERFPTEISDISATFRPDGIVGAGTLHLGRMAFRVASRIGITLVDDKPQAVIYEAKIGTLQVPEPILKFLERRINRLIGRKFLPLKIKRVDLRQGAAYVSVELA
jgi:hypothetical protein